LLETVEYGFLIGNAPDELKKKFMTHTADNNHDGIFYALLEMNLI
jgi:hydroxymethylpyrimidine pyrophosphatase-like HAD family hydrolase